LLSLLSGGISPAPVRLPELHTATAFECDTALTTGGGIIISQATIVA